MAIELINGIELELQGGTRGLQGIQGEKGDPGNDYTPMIGEVDTLEPGLPATVSTSIDEEQNIVYFNFGIPKGAKGDKGDTNLETFDIVDGKLIAQDQEGNTYYLGTVAMSPEGDYDPTKTYERLNTVVYNNSTYMAIKQATGIVPTNTEYWNLIAPGYDNMAVKKTNFYFAPVNNSGLNSSGDCSIIKTANNKIIMIDTGVDENYLNIKEFLQNIEVTKIDYLIISHYHADHVGNLESLMEDFDFSNTICFLPLIPSSVVYNTPYTLSQTVLSLLVDNEKIYPNNGTFTIDNLTLEFINSTQDDLYYYTNNNLDYNNCSICTYVKDRNITFFYTGDIKYEAEERLVSLNLIKNSNGYKVEHHGVNGITNSDYLKKFTPNIVIVTNSQKNTLESEQSETAGILTEKTISYFSSLNSKIYLNSFTDSYFEFISDGQTLESKDKYYQVRQRDNSINDTNNEMEIYVNNNYTGVSDGSINKPFKYINDAIRFSNYSNCSIKIKLEDGYYNEKVYITNATNKITLQGNTNDNSKVKIKQLIIFNCNSLKLYYLNFNQAVNNVIRVDYSKINISNCLINGNVLPNNVLDGRGISFYASEAVIENTTISNKTIAVAAFDNSNISIASLQGTNNNYLYGPYYNSIIKSNFTNASYNTLPFIINQGGLYIGDCLEKGLYVVGLNENFETQSQSLEQIPLEKAITNINSIALLENGSITIKKNVQYISISGTIDLTGGFQSGDTIALEIRKNGTAVYIFVKKTNSSNRFYLPIPSKIINVAKNDIISLYITNYSRTGLKVDKDTRYTDIQIKTENIY